MKLTGRVGTGGEGSTDCLFARNGGGVGTRSCIDRFDNIEVLLVRRWLFEDFLTREATSGVEPFADGYMIVRRTIVLR